MPLKGKWDYKAQEIIDFGGFYVGQQQLIIGFFEALTDTPGATHVFHRLCHSVVLNGSSWKNLRKKKKTGKVYNFYDSPWTLKMILTGIRPVKCTSFFFSFPVCFVYHTVFLFLCVYHIFFSCKYCTWKPGCSLWKCLGINCHYFVIIRLKLPYPFKSEIQSTILDGAICLRAMGTSAANPFPHGFGTAAPWGTTESGKQNPEHLIHQCDFIFLKLRA